MLKSTKYQKVNMANIESSESKVDHTDLLYNVENKRPGAYRMLFGMRDAGETNTLLPVMKKLIKNNC